MELIDSHAHIDVERFGGGPRRDAGARAGGGRDGRCWRLGLGRAGEVGCGDAVCRAHDWIYATIGIHPHDAKEVTKTHLDELARLAKHPQRDCVGRNWVSTITTIIRRRDVQERVFRDQMELARAAKQPIMIHCRDAWRGLPEIAGRRLGADRARRDLALLYSDAGRSAKRGVDMGFMISFAGNSTYPKTQNLRDVARSFAVGAYSD